MDKILNTNIQFKNDSEENWSKATNFIPMKGELIIYNTDDAHIKNRIKVGNGENFLSKLAFVDNKYIQNAYIDGLFEGYINQVPLSTEVNSSRIYNNIGYKSGYRLSSTGVEKEQTNSVATGYIKATTKDTIRMSGVAWTPTVTDGYCYICFYDEQYNLLATINEFKSGTENGVSNMNPGTILNSSKSAHNIVKDNAGVYTFNLSYNENASFSYIRISAEGQGENLIITLNETIKEGD